MRNPPQISFKQFQVNQLVEQCRKEFDGFQAITILENGQFSIITKERAYASNEIPPEPPGMNETGIKRITLFVAHTMKVNYSHVMSRSKKADVARSRHVAMYLARELLALTLTEIGKAFDRDHGTVIHACRTIKDICSVDAQTRRLVESLKKLLEPGCENGAMVSTDELNLARKK